MITRSEPVFEDLSVVILGSGHVATALSLALDAKGVCPKQIYSPTAGRAAHLAEQLSGSVTAVSDLKAVYTDADLYLLAVSDRAIESVVASMPTIGGVVAHTAGSVPMNVLRPVGDHFGVFYPLQTFTTGRSTSFDNLPVYVEYASGYVGQMLQSLGRGLDCCVYEADSVQRSALHLAAVFVCNFTNHFYAIGEDILVKAGLDASALLPLIRETACKVQELPALRAQTGPAARNDEETMLHHLQLLSSDLQRAELYKQVSSLIIHTKLKTNRE